ncbi:MAG: dihydrolipoamide acetyltransferase family protein [Chloroflexota bacterium]
MPTKIQMPQLGESVVEGTVAQWLKQPGETVQKLEPLLEITTDKIDTEIPAPDTGTLLSILVPEGETVAAGTVLGYIGQPDEVVEEAESSAPVVSETANSLTHQQENSTGPVKEKPVGRSFISPVVARIAAEENVNLAQVAGTGLNGRITKKDILAFVAQRGQVVDEAQAIVTETPKPVTSKPLTVLADDEILQPLTAMRRAIANHMVQSKQTSPHVTTIFEADMTRVVQHRYANKEALVQKGINLTFTPYFMAAVIDGLRAVPDANSHYTDDGLVLKQRIHLGVAVALDDGLIVPVLRDADERNLLGLARGVNDLASRARSGQLTPDEIVGGTFTVTNHGTSGSLIGTPIINQPQAGILGIGAIVKRPVVVNTNDNHSLLPDAGDAIVIRPMCYLNFSFDHRVLDGARADAFVKVVKEKLENWS